MMSRMPVLRISSFFVMGLLPYGMASATALGQPAASPALTLQCVGVGTPRTQGDRMLYPLETDRFRQMGGQWWVGKDLVGERGVQVLVDPYLSIVRPVGPCEVEVS